MDADFALSKRGKKSRTKTDCVLSVLKNRRRQNSIRCESTGHPGQKKDAAVFRIISGDGSYNVLRLFIGNGDGPVAVTDNIEQIVV